jgi:hypothetical protein
MNQPAAEPFHEATSMQKLWTIVGILFAVCGLFMIWFAYAFSTLIDPDLQGDARRSEIFHNLTSKGASPLGLGILLICGGIWLVFSKPKRQV